MLTKAVTCLNASVVKGEVSFCTREILLCCRFLPIYSPSHKYSLNKMLLRTSKILFGNKDSVSYLEQKRVQWPKQSTGLIHLSCPMISLFPPLSSDCPPLELFIHYSLPLSPSLPSASCCSPPSLILSPSHRSFFSEVSNILRKGSHVHQANKNTVIIQICVRSFHTEIKQKEYEFWGISFIVILFNYPLAVAGYVCVINMHRIQCYFIQILHFEFSPG